MGAGTVDSLNERLRQRILNDICFVLVPPTIEIVASIAKSACAD